MPAYAKVTLVSPVFHPSDIAFAVSWGECAVGWGGWKVLVDKEESPEAVAVAPPGLDEPVFFLHRDVGEVVLEREPPGHPRVLVGRYPNLRNALQALCPLDDATLEEINEGLELSFPRQREPKD